MDSTQTYLFVDGGYLEQTLIAHGTNFFGRQLDLNLNFLSARALKSFYYDAYPTKKGAESDDDFKKRLAETEKKFDHISSHAGWHVNPGMTRGLGKKVRQKGVDVQLAVDALTHSVRKNCRHVLLLTGDLDFLPLIRALVQEGVYVTLMHDPRTSSKDLLREADSHELFGVRKVRGIAIDNDQLHVPDWVNCPESGLQLGNFIRGGKTDQGTIELHSIGGGFAANQSFDGSHRFVQHNNLDQLTYLVETEFTHLKWTSGLES
jgi:uncharacterized LabA/DUF88 family protein